MNSFIQRGTMSDAEQSQLIWENEYQEFKSDFHFLNEHKGWRPGKVHTIVAPTHSGKSTMTRSLIWDFLINNPCETVFVWLSEESAEDFRTEFARLRLDKLATSRLYIGSEQDSTLGLDNKKFIFAESIKEIRPSIVFFDNVTTSEFYMGRKVDEQSSFAMYLKRTCKEMKIPFVIIAHSGGAIQMNKRLIELNDIRGGKDIVNITEFAYVLQRFRVQDPMSKKESYFPTVRIEKHRGYTCENLLFKLRFNKATVSFMEDKIVPWAEFKEAFKNQLTL
jgi:hypothetical protein